MGCESVEDLRLKVNDALALLAGRTSEALSRVDNLEDLAVQAGHTAFYRQDGQAASSKSAGFETACPGCGRCPSVQTSMCTACKRAFVAIEQLWEAQDVALRTAAEMVAAIPSMAYGETIMAAIGRINDLRKALGAARPASPDVTASGAESAVRPRQVRDAGGASPEAAKKARCLNCGEVICETSYFPYCDAACHDFDPIDSAAEEDVEHAYWQYDHAHKQGGQSERDAFKGMLRAEIRRAVRADRAERVGRLTVSEPVLDHALRVVHDREKVVGDLAATIDRQAQVIAHLEARLAEVADQLKCTHVCTHGATLAQGCPDCAELPTRQAQTIAHLKAEAIRQTQTIAHLEGKLEGERRETERVKHAWNTATTQATNCARCQEYKHTPWRDANGYVCAGCTGAEIAELKHALTSIVGKIPLGQIGTDVLAERHRQDAKWGGPATDDQRSHQDWHRFINDHSFRAIAETPLLRRRQLIRVAALAVAAVESHDRQAAAGAPPDAAPADPSSYRHGWTPVVDASVAAAVPADQPAPINNGSCTRAGHWWGDAVCEEQGREGPDQCRVCGVRKAEVLVLCAQGHHWRAEDPETDQTTCVHCRAPLALAAAPKEALN